MRKKDFKGRCIKKPSSKSPEALRTFDKVQTAYVDVLESDTEVSAIECNVLLTGVEEDQYTTDFLVTKADGTQFVRECVYRKQLSLPHTCKLLDISRKYWFMQGISDWAIIINMEEQQ